MGMFDYVECEVELPGDPVDWEAGGPGFQTKDLDCWLDKLKITKDGKLMRLHYELRETGEVETWGKDKEGNLLQFPIRERVNEEWREYSIDGRKYHGDFYFYSSDRHKVWHEYLAKFNDGQLVEITCVENRKDK